MALTLPKARYSVIPSTTQEMFNTKELSGESSKEGRTLTFIFGESKSSCGKPMELIKCLEWDLK
ncbi:hypothetical protein KIN20_007564 [Parelaphostrongylus tenuis]|uniref:Uncharacterized protein n=1 Tax=Parelaphostrongylus tenuis TaxID=148309 RepID=A0AAD5MLM4_PARTN|nr:hypothetical protein KIN20_007564 [Parelaphostrongylus tenuis]